MQLVSLASLLGVVVVALGMVLTPGPNMVYLASRSISQGRRAGLVSLAGVALGFIVYLLAAAAGLSALFVAVPEAYQVVKLAGAAYLAWLAWQMLRPGGGSPFEPRDLAPHSPRRLFGMGVVTNLLNPKIALMYAALIPQFVDPALGAAWWQFLQLGTAQIVVAVTVNALIVLTSAALAGFLTRHPRVLQAQRFASGTLLGFFAAKMATSRPHS
ncbi:lysine transporter LysE [Nocardioides gansuensis]|uniref:Lysine transporter LysE n=1 Tax=Nocardioides gansuensis TaxID=2138300 RepID=A0A2T8FC34_9ACTN|nr:LysE family translocator [Nocardioides gansuensis]PVG83262.1 lysine transporter LysE [Nocardioides gansuensis]